MNSPSQCLQRLSVLLLLLLPLVWSGLVHAETVTITVFDRVEVNPGAQRVTTTVDLPIGPWDGLTYEVHYDGVDDPWDRVASLSVLKDGKRIELRRDITDYGWDTREKADMSHFARLLQGPTELEIYIPSWVGTVGWRVTVTFTYTRGMGYRAPSAVLPVTSGMEEIANGDVATPFSRTYKVTLPPNLTDLGFQLIATGHSYEGRGAEEFGPARTITVSLDGKALGSYRIWKTGCDHPNNHGTTYARSGWCPGMKVDPIYVPVTNAHLLAPGEYNVTIAFNRLSSYFFVSLSGYLSVSGERPANPPRILLAGWWDSVLRSYTGSVRPRVVLSDPDQDATRVDLLVAGQPTGLVLTDRGETQDGNPRDGFFADNLNVTTKLWPTPPVLIEMVALDQNGNRSGVWPYLNVW